MGYSKHELSTINMWYSLKKIHITPLPPHNGHFLLSPSVDNGFDFPPIRPISVLPFVFAAYHCLNVSKSRDTAPFNNCGNVEKSKSFFRPA